MVKEGPVYRFRFNGAAAAIIIVAILASLGTWLTLVLVGLVKVESIYPLLERIGYFLTGAFMPGMISVWRERRLKFDIQSDPPPSLKDDNAL